MADSNHKLVNIRFTIFFSLVVFFMFFIFNAPNKVKENLNIFQFQASFFFSILHAFI